MKRFITDGFLSRKTSLRAENGSLHPINLGWIQITFNFPDFFFKGKYNCLSELSYFVPEGFFSSKDALSNTSLHFIAEETEAWDTCTPPHPLAHQWWSPGVNLDLYFSEVHKTYTHTLPFLIQQVLLEMCRNILSAYWGNSACFISTNSSLGAR